MDRKAELAVGNVEKRSNSVWGFVRPFRESLMLVGGIALSAAAGALIGHFTGVALEDINQVRPAIQQLINPQMTNFLTFFGGVAGAGTYLSRKL